MYRHRAVKPLDHFHAIIAGEAEPPPVAKLVGFELTEVEAGRAVFEMDAARSTQARSARCTVA